MKKAICFALSAFLAAQSWAGWEISQSRSTASGTVWIDSQDTRKGYYETILGTDLNYRVDGPDGTTFANVDMTPVRDTAGGNDGWRVTQNGWHFFLGRPTGKGTDGWVGFGGRQGERWIYQRLVRAGYLEYTGRAWDDIGGAPNYARANLSSSAKSVTVGPAGAQLSLNVAAGASWRNIWTTPGGGELYLSWTVEGRHLKEDVVLNAAARTWIAANRPPATAPATTYFGFVFQLDASDIPRVLKGGVQQDMEGDFDDDNGASGIDLRNAGNAIVGFLPVSVAFSQDRRTSVKLRKRIWKDGDGNLYLLVGAKVADLNGLPAGDVIFDPTITAQPDATSGVDTYIRSDATTSNFGTDTLLQLATTNRKALLKFDVSLIPSNATCDSAVMTVFSDGGGGGGAWVF